MKNALGKASDAEDEFAQELTSIMAFRLSRKATEITRQIAGAQILLSHSHFFFFLVQFIASLAKTHSVCVLVDKAAHTSTLQKKSNQKKKKSKKT